MLKDVVKQYDEFVITSMLSGIDPVVVDKAEGCYLISKDGEKYLDCFSGISVTNVGHSHSKIIAAAKNQIDKVVHSGTYLYYSPVAAKLAEKLAKITPGDLQKTFFGNSGAEAIEGVLRIAKQFTNKKEIVSLTHSFHGRTLGTLSITGNSGRKHNFGPFSSGVAFGPSPYCYRCLLRLKYPSCKIACAEMLEDVVRFQTSNDVAAFIMEPIQGEGGIIVPPKEYFTKVQQIVKKTGALLIIDEVQTGFGRTGKLFASEHFNIKPDCLVLAKGIANGFPLSGFIVRSDIANAFKPGDHLSTFGGNSVSCAASLATIDVLMDEGLIENSAVCGDYIMQRLHNIKKKYSIIGDVRGKGLMIGIELVRDDKKTPADTEAKEIKKILREKGILIGLGGVYGNVLRLQPPLSINQNQCDIVCEAMEKAISQIIKRAKG